MAPGSPSPPRDRANRVSVQHTLERVRNNQRRHRARRKDYIATLEQRLADAELTISSLRGQVEALQTALTQCRHEPHDQNEADCRTLQAQQLRPQDGTSPTPRTDAHGEADQASGVLSDIEDLGAWELTTSASVEPLISDDQPTLEVNAFISPPAENHEDLIYTPQLYEFIAEPSLFTPPASNQAVAEAGSLLPATVIQDQTLTSTTPCCSSDPLSSSQMTFNTANGVASVPNQTTSLLIPGNISQPATETTPQANPNGESTMLCSEAHILIARQNFKGITQREVATWLWNGFRRSLQPGEGCRVNTDMLFSLLAFISDTQY
ncbi:Fc.00g057820.m01.CDS01 [Cosmosporella sp. VM-42]